MSRTVWVLLALLLLILLGLGGLFLWLTGAFEQTKRDEESKPVAGLIHVRTIYTADGENLYRPVGIGAADDGSFLVTLRDAQRVVSFDRSGEWRSSWGERGLEQGQFMAPIGVAVDRLAGHVYVTDRSRLRLLCYTLDGEFLWEVPVLNPLAPFVRDEGIGVLTFGPIAMFTDQGEVAGQVGTRGIDKGQFDYPRAAASLSASEAIVADSNNNRVQRISFAGDVTATVKWVDGTPTQHQEDADTEYGLPSGIAVDDRGRAFVLDGFRHEIVVLDTQSGKRIHKFAELQGRGDGRFNLPTGIAHLGDDYFAITDTYNDRVQIVRLLLPGEDNVVRRYPWLVWLAPLALLALLPLVLGKKRWYATEQALDVARSENNLRLLAAVAGKLHVLPEVRERYADHREEGIAIAEFLVAVEPGSSEDSESRLAESARPTRGERLLLRRVRVIVDSDEQAERLGTEGVKPVTYQELTANYSIATAGPSSSHD